MGHSSSYELGLLVGRLLGIAVGLAIPALILFIVWSNSRATTRRFNETRQVRWNALVARFGPELGARLFAGQVQSGDTTEMLSAAFGAPNHTYEDPNGGQIAVWFVAGNPNHIARQLRLRDGVFVG